MTPTDDHPAESIFDDTAARHDLATPHPARPTAPTEPSTGDLEEFDNPLDQLSTPHTRPIHPDHVRLQTLRWVLALFCGVLILGATGALIGGDTWTTTKDFLNITFATVTGLVGTVVGFYFSRNGNSPK